MIFEWSGDLKCMSDIVLRTDVIYTEAYINICTGSYNRDDVSATPIPWSLQVATGGSTLVVEEELGEGRQAHEVVQHAARVGVQRRVVVRLPRQQRAAAFAPGRLQVLNREDKHIFKSRLWISIRKMIFMLYFTYILDF